MISAVRSFPKSNGVWCGIIKSRVVIEKNTDLSQKEEEDCKETKTQHFKRGNFFFHDAFRKLTIAFGFDRR